MLKVSIITVVFNNATHLKDAIESVLSQTTQNIEYIVVDGGSTDGSLEIIHSYNDRISTVLSGPDKGIYDALNKGIRLAHGDIIGILHSDDIFDNGNVIKNMVDHFAFGNYDALYGDLVYVKASDPNVVVRYWKSGLFTEKSLQRGWMPPHPALFLKRELFQKFGYYNIHFRISADYDLILRIFSSKNFVCGYLPEVITRMRVGGASNKSLRNIIQKSKEDLVAIRKNKAGGIMTLIRKNFSKLGQFLITPSKLDGVS